MDNGIVFASIVLTVFGLFGLLALVVYRNKAKVRRAPELLDLDRMTRDEFGEYVASLLSHRGFEIEEANPLTDVHVDIVAEKAGTRYAIRVTRQPGRISQRVVRETLAGKRYYDCDAAMVIATTSLTEGALELARLWGCELVDGDVLARWVRDLKTITVRQRQQVG